MSLKSKEEAMALTATLQNGSESAEARCAACEQILLLTKNDSACSVLCSVGGIHAVINAIKTAHECEQLLKGAVLTLRNLYRFDPKLTCIVVRLQEGVGALLDGLRDHIHCCDVELLQARAPVLPCACACTLVVVFARPQPNLPMRTPPRARPC